MMHKHGTKMIGGWEVEWVCHQNRANSVDSDNQSTIFSENSSSPCGLQSLHCS